MAGMVMVGFVLVAALTLGVALAPSDVTAGGDAFIPDSDDSGTPGVDPSPSPDVEDGQVSE